MEVFNYVESFFNFSISSCFLQQSCLIFEALEHEVQFVEVERLRSLTEELKDIPELRWQGREDATQWWAKKIHKILPNIYKYYNAFKLVLGWKQSNEWLWNTGFGVTYLGQRTLLGQRALVGVSE